MMSAQNLLSKMDPMVRKLETELESFKDALSKNDLVSAQQHLKGIAQTSDFLAEDVTEIYKSETREASSIGPNDIYAGGVPVMQFKEQGVIQKGEDRPAGYIGPDGVMSDWKPQSGYGQRVGPNE
tara:strand:- start:5277 stop:5651 length:375 start_codon:yes stop_codon:yes gene_type:complete